LSRSHVSCAAPHPYLTALAFSTLAAVCAAPLLLDSADVWFLPPYPTAWQSWLAHGSVLLIVFVVVGIRAFLDRDTEPHAFALHALFLTLAATLTLIHWLQVDSHSRARDWQLNLYVRLLRHEYEPPHQYRPLPYGFVRSLEWVTHDFYFSCIVYRAFFTYWFVWGWYRLARTVHSPGQALYTLAVLVPLYPLSNRYLGQLTDPLSHALFVAALLWVVEDRPFALAAALALGVMAKETVVIVLPAYFTLSLGQPRKGLLPAAVVTGWLGLACVLAFLLVRLPLGWQPGEETMNGAGLMIGTNLGIGEPIAYTTAPRWENFLHPILFVGAFLPFIAARWRTSDWRLRILFVTLTPLLLLSNLCFGWLYESRNYVPLLPVLATLALPARPKPAAASPLLHGP
jgi:hypothetical protein